MSPKGSPEPSSKEVSPRHSAEERQSFEDLKQAMEEEHKKQLDAVKREIEEMQRQLEEARERYQQAEEGLEEKKKELSDDQQKFLQQQIDEQNKRFDLEILWKNTKAFLEFFIDKYPVLLEYFPENDEIHHQVARVYTVFCPSLTRLLISVTFAQTGKLPQKCNRYGPFSLLLIFTGTPANLILKT